MIVKELVERLLQTDPAAIVQIKVQGETFCRDVVFLTEYKTIVLDETPYEEKKVEILVKR